MSRWDLAAIDRTTTYEVIATDGALRGIRFANEPYRGKPTHAVAWLGVPETGGGSIPGVVCIHGGGGKAYPEWVRMWNERGYAAISMNLRGNGLDGARLPDGGPDHDGPQIFDLSEGFENLWTFHAVSAVLRSRAILAAEPRVDPARIGVTGISWGGYYTCIVAGIEPRFACAVPVYGCGFLQHNSVWMPAFAAMTPDARARWHDLCDPSVFVRHARMPMLFVTGTNDLPYPLDSHRMTCQVVPGPVNCCVRLRMEHSHTDGWAPAEIAWFMDHHLRGGEPLPVCGRLAYDGHRLRARVKSARPIRSAWLIATDDTGAWPERDWRQVPADYADGVVSTEYPEEAEAFFLAVEDDRGAYASTLHGERADKLLLSVRQ